MKKILAIFLLILIPAVLIGLSLRTALAYESSGAPLPPRPTVSPHEAGDDTKTETKVEEVGVRPDIVLLSNATEVPAGQQLTFTILVTNNQDDRATGVEVRMPVDENLQVLSTATSKGRVQFNNNNRNVKAIIGGLQPGTSEVVTIVVKVKKSAPERIYNFAGLVYKDGLVLSNQVNLTVLR